VCVPFDQTKKLLENFHELCCEYFAVGQTELRNCNFQFDIRSSDVEVARATLVFGSSTDLDHRVFSKFVNRLNNYCPSDTNKKIRVWRAVFRNATAWMMKVVKIFEVIPMRNFVDEVRPVV